MLRHCEPLGFYSFFFFNDTATTEIYTLSLHDALPILETVVRLGLPMVIVIYDDEAYGAEVHHFGPDGFPLDTVRFPAADIAAIGRGYGCAGVTVREPGDLAPVRDWLAGPRDRPLVIDAKVASASGSWWLEEAFRGH